MVWGVACHRESEVTRTLLVRYTRLAYAHLSRFRIPGRRRARHEVLRLKVVHPIPQPRLGTVEGEVEAVLRELRRPGKLDVLIVAPLRPRRFATRL